MVDLPASERAYQRLRHDILNGVVSAGPVDIRKFGDTLRMSVTPVREALARLSAERLVKPSPHHGYVIIQLSPRRLENLYELSGALLPLALRRCKTAVRTCVDVAPPSRDMRTYEAGMTCLLGEIARAQGNLELCEHLEAINDRLLPARRCEAVVFPDAREELDVLARLWDNRRFPRLGAWLEAHLVSRIAQVDAIARVLTDAMDKT